MTPSVTRGIEEAVRAANASAFHASLHCYRTDSSAAFVVTVTSLVLPQLREKFDQGRAVRIIDALTSDTALPPVEVDRPPGLAKGQFRLKDGFHRVVLAQRLGFAAVPAVEVSYFEL
jgi:hypothetical protein